ncbi:hypothetical protein C4D60_Mb08t23210 [Musa balbisiana]|uniref:Uncharacterized protein n=1 Tax=Musa balbisiana TaxID=52838 RepID=A0A4S8K5V3_MUSBA|nr:hypothetical protein C4D60_Mb08t23210 [Musa balbisiana]
MLIMARLCIPFEGARKRKRGEQSFGFDSFCDTGNPTPLTGSFQDKLKALLMFAHPEAVEQGELQCHSFQLELHRHPPTSVRLFVLEEDAETSTCRRCRYCVSVGWGHHIICSKRIHFVLPTKDTLSEVQNICLHANAEWSKKPTAGSKLVNTNRCLLHGVLHSNGFGHLLRINGFEGGSHFLSGHQIMDLWDRICTALQVRKMSVIDASTKGKMELRLVHGVAYGEPWFGRWGYRFGQGSYGVTEQMYQRSVDALHALPLRLLLPRLAASVVKSQ